ncbi:DNA methyltransferase [Phenylobacterium sp.]|uniref:DNA methyltransferase n=1 Tax=Phenylobacterium sp. TaxID=1871053 RepID=UPI0025DE07CE|nr:DNA methyltransferase [Phenylobacterium sp.]MCA3724088.1 class I SAM-dependent DNA methyltransferase [Phenylobacterium sp.]MCA6260356.1 class I SAM-dependent DNA methyltransferase [Phenylobacterium sp.]
MQLSWNEIRARAAAFSQEWADAKYERGETQSFYNDFFEVFGIRRRRVATFEAPVKKLGEKQGFIDLFWKGVLLVEQKSAGRDLTRARDQALDYFPGLKEHELPRYVLTCDFQLFELVDLETGEETRFALADLPQHVERFGFVMGVEKRVFRDQDPVNIIAAELMGKLHDALKASGYDGHPLERLLVRLLFCLFADDTGIFPERGMLEDFIVNRTQPDGSDLGPRLAELFQVLDTPEDRRQSNLDEDLQRFPYVNGELFSEALRIPAFDSKMRDRLLEACGFHWEKISPAIFGALFQSVMNAKERRAKGAHYTTEKNILKVIEPLFLDDLRAEFARLRDLKRGRETALRAFQDKLAGLNLFDPACGCGNFLIIAYRELRALEIEVLRELYPKTGADLGRQADLYGAALTKIDVNQFHGIEIDEFPVRIAETAMWMMDHIMNNRLSLEFGRVFARIPLKAAPNIRHADALETDWAEVLAPERCSYVLGNPPFLGAKIQTEEQRAQVRRIAALGKSGGTLDFVAAWFLKAGEYLRTSQARIGFVATNSITQGEQVAQLWPLLFDRYGLEITFAHRTFAWGSDARGKAHVHVVIIGLSSRALEPPVKRLFSYSSVDGDPTESRHSAISPYLFDASSLGDRHLVVREESRPLGVAPKVVIGSKPIDGGHYIFERAEADAFLLDEPKAKPFMRPFVGAEEYINGGDRWILYLRDAAPEQIRGMPNVAARISAVRQKRLDSPSAGTRALADFPTRFHVTVVPDRPFLCIPKVSSERRSYVPIGWLHPPTIPSDLVFVLEDASLERFALLTSSMHMAWLRNIGGRLKSDYRYSVGLVYNPFPWPNLEGADRSRLDTLAQSVLDARTAHPGATLADLYDPDVMPADLRKAHRALDLAVDRLYRKEAFADDRERVEHLFRLYEQMTAGLLAKLEQPKRRRPTKVVAANE